jgi:hypothetical protein
MLRFAIAFFPLHFVSENQKCVHFARRNFDKVLYPQPPPDEKFLDQSQALACD